MKPRHFTGLTPLETRNGCSDILPITQVQDIVMTFYCLFIFVFVNVCVLLHVHFDSLSLGLFSAFYVLWSDTSCCHCFKKLDVSVIPICFNLHKWLRFVWISQYISGA